MPLHHAPHDLWRFERNGFYLPPQRPAARPAFPLLPLLATLQPQTFSVTYWLKCPRLLPQVISCPARLFGLPPDRRAATVSPSTVLTHSARLGPTVCFFHQRPPPAAPPSRGTSTASRASSSASTTPPGSTLWSRREPLLLWLHRLRAAAQRPHDAAPETTPRRARATHRVAPYPRSIEREVHPSASNSLGAPASGPDAPNSRRTCRTTRARCADHVPHLTVTHHVTPGSDPRTGPQPLLFRSTCSTC
jgi:hypothetical protein